MTAANDRVIATDNWERFQEAEKSGHRDFVRRAMRNDRFYYGEQWDPNDKAKLDADGRPALTLNLILSTVNAVIGEQLERKVEPVFRAAAGGTEDAAFALNRITRCILADNDFDTVEETVFADGVIAGRGFYDVRLDFDTNVQGEVRITAEDPVDVIIDAGAKESDPSTWSEVFIARWMTPDEVAATYGQAKGDAVTALKDTAPLAAENLEFAKRTFGGEATPGTESTASEKTGDFRRVRVIERQYYKFTRGMFYVDLRTGDTRPVPHTVKKEDAIALVESDPNLSLIERPTRRVRITVSADCVLLSDDWSPYRSFTIVPFFPYFRRGKPFGVVDNLIDPQILLNKSSSQELHIVNTTANSGWVVQEGSLVNMEPEDLETEGARTGLVLTYRRGFERPDKIIPNSVPTGIERISMKASGTIREVSSVNAAMLGTTRADQSGRAQEAAIARGQVQVSVVLSNLRKCRMLVLRKVLELVQDYYTEHRVFTMVGDSVVNGESDESVEINVPQPDGSIMNDVTLGNYAIEVDYRPAGGSLYDKEFEECMRMREMGIAIPDHIVVQYSNLTKRAEVSEFLKASQGFGEPSEQEQQLQQFQLEHQVQMLQRELAHADAEIKLLEAQAAEKMVDVSVMDGYNEMQARREALQNARDMKEKEMSLRIALAARSHQNQSTQNDKRLRTQMAMRAIDYGIQSKRGATTQQANSPSKSK